jgi:uncharacterized protein (DUF952 family)
MAKKIYHIAQRADWEAAQAAGEYRVDSLTSEGFIHFSEKRQVLLVANTFYAGQRDIILLAVDKEELAAALRYDEHPGPDGEVDKFPHLYGPLNLEAVVGVYTLPVGPDGQFRLPAALEG